MYVKLLNTFVLLHVLVHQGEPVVAAMACPNLPHSFDAGESRPAGLLFRYAWLPAGHMWCVHVCIKDCTHRLECERVLVSAVCVMNVSFL
jgi:hypothetical protein